MTWEVLIHEDFNEELQGLEALHADIQDELMAKSALLEAFGPSLGRPYVGKLDGSKYSNMKELRFDADDGVWRVLFAFDTKRQAILLAAGDKRGVNQKRFYKQIIDIATQRFEDWMESVE